MTREPHPEHAAARLIMDKLAKASGMPSGQALIQHLTALPPDSPGMKLIGEAVSMSIPKATPEPPLAEVG